MSNKVISIEYTLNDAESKVQLDTNVGGAPLEFISDMGQIIPGLEKELVNLNTGDKINHQKIIEYIATLVNSNFEEWREENQDISYAVGTKVLHPKFGAGIIIKRDGSEDDLKVDVFFKKTYGKKRIAINIWMVDKNG